MEDTDNYYEWVNTLIDNDVISRLLKEYYDDEELFTVTVNGETQRYLVGTHPQLLYPHFTEDGLQEWTFQNPQISDLDEEYWKQAEKILAIRKGDSIESDSFEQGSYIWNDPTYLAVDTEFDDPNSSLVFQRTEGSDYYTNLGRSQQLLTELIDAIDEDHFIGSDKIYADRVLQHELPIRDRYFSNTVDRVKNLSERPHSIGGTYLTLIKSDDTYYVITGSRSNDVSTWPDRYTVIPAGIMQPTDISLGSPIVQHMLTEYAIEFFDYETPSSSSRAVKSLHQLLSSDGAMFDVTGSGIDLTYGNTEVSGILVISYESYLDFIDEHSSNSFQHDKLHLIPLDEIGDHISTLTSPRNITPTSAFALFTGLKYLQTETDIEVPLDIDIQQQQIEHPDRFPE